MRTKLMNKEGEGGGGGGETPDIAKLVADAVAAALPKALNGAITSHMNRVTAKFEERFKAIEKPPVDDDEAGGEGGEGAPVVKPKGGAGGLSPEVEARIRAAEKRAEKAEKTAAEEKTIRERAVAEGRVKEERATLQDALVAAGVQKKMLGPAVAFLYGEQKRIKRLTAEGQDDKLVWVDGDEEHSIADGVKAWTKSEDGMGFMPSRDVGGSGGTGGGRGGAGGGGGQQGMDDRAFIDALTGSTPQR